MNMPSSPSDATPPDDFARVSDARVRLVERLLPQVVSVHGAGQRCSGLRWREGFVVTADEALPDAREIAISAAVGPVEAIVASIAGRDAGTDVALLRVGDVAGMGAAAGLGDAAGAGDAPPDEGGAAQAPTAAASEAPALGATVLVLGASADGPVVVDGIVSHVGAAWHSIRGGLVDQRIELGLRLPPVAEGGPVFDARGTWIGMAVFGPRRRVLVIPALTIERIAGRLATDGRIPRGYLGMGLRPVHLDGGGHGLLVANVDPQGPAARSGIHQGDLITRFAGDTPRAPRALIAMLGPDSVGTTVAIGLRRGGADSELALTIGERPAP
ncbi:MAG: S1C family serine protease [Lautropia sp.]